MNWKCRWTLVDFKFEIVNGEDANKQVQKRITLPTGNNQFQLTVTKRDNGIISNDVKGVEGYIAGTLTEDAKLTFNNCKYNWQNYSEISMRSNPVSVKSFTDDAGGDPDDTGDTGEGDD